MRKNLIFVTGYLGSPIEDAARQIAREKGLDFLSLDEEIEKEDGRSVLRICMMMGEHEYRNKEYEMLQKIADGEQNNLVVSCSDGVLYDDMSKSIIMQNELVVVGSDMNCDELWERACRLDSSYHAFLHFGTAEEKRKAFDDFCERQCMLFGDNKMEGLK